MNIADEEFEDEFQTFGFKIDNEELYDTLRTLCQQYRLDASDMAMEWVAFSHTHKQCKLTGDTLDHMERERLTKKGAKVAKTPKAKASREPVYDISSLEDVLNAGDAGDLMDAYATPKGKNPNKRQHTPDQPMNKRVTALGRSPAVNAPFSPASLSPANATPSKKYSTRTNQGEVVLSFGNTKNVRWQTKRMDQCNVTPFDKETTLTAKFKYMFQKLSDKAIILNDLIDTISSKLQKHYSVTELGHVALPMQETMAVVGRVGCDSQGKINAKSVVLEGSQETSGAKCTPLDVSDAKQYSLFPGQIIMLDAVNTTGNSLLAKKIYEGVPPPAPAGDRPNLPTDGLRIVVACGPFTTSDSLMYEPLADLIKGLQRDPPDVCIMLGPFVDAKHPEIEKGNLNSTYEEFFRRTIEQMSTAIQRLPTQLLVLPSQRDIHHEYVYPQPPFTLSGLDNKQVHFLPDPCMVKIDGVVLGLTSTDILFHLGLEEISHPPGSSDRLARLAGHLLTQQSFYPLYPPAEEISIDFDHFDVYAKMGVRPDVLVIPSDLRYFLKDVSGCCCVNPGRLTKGQVGGTYVRMKVAQPADSKVPLVQSIVGEVVRV